MNTTRVLALLPLLVGLAHCFSWDIVLGEGKQLKFYKNRTLIHTEDNPSSKEIHSVTYDPVNYRVLFADYSDSTGLMSISSYELTTNKIQILVTRQTSAYLKYLAYDPLTLLLFWTEDMEIYSLSLTPASSNEAVDGKLLVTLDHYCRAIAVDSCGGYIYWVTDQNIERATFDGTEREVILDKTVLFRTSLAIDHQTQKMYWTEIINMKGYCSQYIQYAELNGKNITTLYYTKKTYYYNAVVNSLAISKDFIYWKSYDEKAILQLPKNEQLDVKPTVYSISSLLLWDMQRTAANYTILEQTQGTKVCESLKSLIPKAPVTNTSDIGLLNVTTVSEESCSTCQHYCFQGNCSVSAEGHPKCSCEAGYFGERCEVNVCYKHCLHGGICSLNEEEEPFCQCTGDYEGERCDVATSLTGVHVHAKDATQEILRELRREAKKFVKEELERALQFFSDLKDEYDANI